jgi:hypothetical protein
MSHQDQSWSFTDEETRSRYVFRDLDGDVTMLDTDISEQLLGVMDRQLSEELTLADSCVRSEGGVEYYNGDFLITWRAGPLWNTVGLPLVAQMVRLLNEWRYGNQESPTLESSCLSKYDLMDTSP